MLLRRGDPGSPAAGGGADPGPACRPWEVVQRDPDGRTREPCPLGAFSDGRLILSVNPTLAPPDASSGPAEPRMLVFPVNSLEREPETLRPPWNGAPPFTEHSYRGLAVDGRRNELLLLNVEGHHAQHWTFLDRKGCFRAQGRLDFPVGDYPEPQRIRLCYPTVALRDRAAHVLAISDIVEPVRAWRDFKFQLTGRKWDYDFRRLFYTWTPDITATPFRPWREIDGREATAGSIRNLDVWIAPDGAAHLLWWVQSLDPRLRERFFPGEALVWSLEHGVIHDGRLQSRTRLFEGREGDARGHPGWARLHATPAGRLFVFLHWTGAETSENRLVELHPDGGHGPVAPVPLEQPLRNFMTATERGGSPPSPVLDVMGTGTEPNTMRYVRIRLPGPRDGARPP